MIATPKKNPWDTTPTGAVDPTAPGGASPWDAPPTTVPVTAAPSVTTPPAATGAPAAPSDTRPSIPGGAPASPVAAIQQLHDGAGGVVPVPPVALAPPSVVPPAAPIAAVAGNGGYDPTQPESRSNVKPLTTVPWGNPAPALAAVHDAAGTAGGPTANGAYPEQVGPVPQTANMGPEAFKAWSAQFPGGVAPQWALGMLDKNEQDQFGNGHGGGNTSGVGSAFSTPTASAPAWEKGAPPGGVPQAGSPMTLAEMTAANTARGGTATLPSPIATPGSATDAAPWTPSASAALPAAPSGNPWDANGAATQPFNDTSNLIGTQINPVTGKRTVNLQGMQDAALGKITSGPDRLALAKQYMDAFKQSTDPQYQHMRTDATNMAAEHGYLGSGRLTNQYGTLEADREQQLKAKELGYLTDAATGTIADNQTAFADTSAAAGQSAALDAEQQAALRGERGYQAQQAAQATRDRQTQQQAEQAAQQQSFQQALQTYLAGNQNNPTGAYETAAGQASSEAGAQSQDVAALLKLIASMGGGGG